MEYRTLSEEYLEIGERIRRRRLELHLSQEQLAERAGISINTLSRLECGQSSTSINKFRRILLALDADANYLIGLEVSKVKEAGGLTVSPPRKGKDIGFSRPIISGIMSVARAISAAISALCIRLRVPGGLPPWRVSLP